MLNKIYFVLTLKWMALMLMLASANGNDLPDNFILVKTFSRKVFWVPIDDPSSSQELTISNTINVNSGLIYNYLINRILLADDDNIWSLPFNNTETQFAGVNLTLVYDIALNPSNGDIYFCGNSNEIGGGVIGVVDSSSSEISLLFETSSPTTVDIVLDHQSQFLFWIAHTDVYRGGMDGSNMTSILSSSSALRGLTMDIKEEQLYWILGDKIYKCDYEGQGHAIFYQDINGAALRDVKVLGNYLYYVYHNFDNITRVNKHDTSDVHLIGPVAGLTNADRLDVYISSEYEVRCSSDDLAGVQLPTSCTLMVGEACDNFTCEAGYEKNQAITSLNCTDSGTCNQNASSLCKEIICSSDDLVHAQLPVNCSSKAGESCDDFICQDGYERNPVVTALNCSESGVWNHNLSTICIVLPDIFLLVKTFTGKVYWIPVDDPSSSQALDISALSDPIPGIVYNNISDQVLLPESKNIWQMSIFDDTKTLFKDVAPYDVNGFAIHPVTGDVYFTGKQSTLGIVGLINSSTGEVTIVHSIDNKEFRDIVVDYIHQSLYWIYNVVNIQYSVNMVGPGTIALQQRPVLVRALDIDLVEDRLYWIEGEGSNDIYSCDLDGGNVIIFLEPNTLVQDLKVFGYYLYYIKRNEEVIYRVNKYDPTDVYEIGPVSGLSLPEHLEVFTATGYALSCDIGDLVGVQLSASCSTKKGESCSNFNCDYGYKKNETVASVTCTQSGSWSLAGSALCIETLCERNFNNGAVAQACGNKVGDSCDNITCTYGFHEVDDVGMFNCTEDGTWDDNMTLLCMETSCERNFTTGAVAVTCENKVGDSCDNITCNNGYQKSETVDQFNCTDGGSWNNNLTSLCTETLCERNFTNGFIAATCGIKVGDSCDSITCNYGFHTVDAGLFNCTDDGTWDYNMTSLCMETLCDRYFITGAVAVACGNKVGDSCDNITCNYGFQEAETVDQFNCTDDGSWNNNLTSLCTETLCDRNFTNGAIAATCGIKVGDSCDSITCNYGFRAADDVGLFNCTEDGTWDYNMTSLCMETLCERNFITGAVAVACRNNVGDSCDNITCNFGFQEAETVNRFNCTEDGLWHYNLTSLCTETLCETNFTTGAVAATCGNKVGDSCDNITCNYGFQVAETVDQFNCTEEGSWNYNLTSLCTETLCERNFTNGAIAATCGIKIGDSCDSITCNYGFQAVDDIGLFDCTVDGIWDYNLTSKCIETICERNFTTGSVAATCGNKVGDSCDNITCNYGFQEAETVEEFNCTEDGSWHYNLMSLCTETLCERNFSNGAIAATCGIEVGDSCDSFTCNYGFQADDYTGLLNCTEDGTWDYNLTSMCIEASCSRNISNGILSHNCSTEVNATCDEVTCNPGYTRNDDVISLVCNGAGLWDYKISFQCETMENAINCQVTPPNETLLTYWIDEIGNTCGYEICNEKYRQLDINESVVCMSDANWEVYSAVLCSASECSGGQSREQIPKISVWTITGLGIMVNSLFLTYIL